eukprot:5880822-Prymnesium_polylepis.1
MSLVRWRSGCRMHSHLSERLSRLCRAVCMWVTFAALGRADERWLSRISFRSFREALEKGCFRSFRVKRGAKVLSQH